MAEEVQRFRPTNGRVTGFLGLGMCALGVVVFALSGSVHTRVSGLIGCAFAAVLVWAAMLRQVAASKTELHMRTLFKSITIPLASIDTVVVRRYLLVRAGGNKYICPAISRSLRKTVRAEMKWNGGGGNLLAPSLSPADPTGSLQTEVKGEHELDYADYVEQQITTLAGNDRDRRGIEARSEEEYDLGAQVVRRTAWLEVVALVVLGAAFVVSPIVGG